MTVSRSARSASESVLDQPTVADSLQCWEAATNCTDVIGSVAVLSAPVHTVVIKEDEPYAVRDGGGGRRRPVDGVRSAATGHNTAPTPTARVEDLSNTRMGIAGVRRKQDRLQLPRLTPRAELSSGAAAKMGPTMARSRAKIANTMAEAATPRSKSPASPSTAVPTRPRAPPCWFHEQRWPSHAAWLPWFATQLPPALPPPCQATIVT